MTAAAEQRREQQAQQARGRPWPKGVSGNPTGRRTSAARHGELFAAIAGEFGDLSPLEREFVSRAADQLRRAERSKDNNEHVRLTRCAAQLIDRVRDLRRERKPEPAGSALDAYLARKRAEAEAGA